MGDLRKLVIKLAHEAGPGELRDKLLPLLKESAGPTWRQTAPGEPPKGNVGAAFKKQRNGINDVLAALRRIREGAQKVDDPDSKALAKKCSEIVRYFMDENARVKGILTGDIPYPGK